MHLRVRALVLLGVLVIATHAASVSKEIEYLKQILKEMQTNRHHKSGTPPNVLFIVADDMGWNDIGYQNSEVITPNMDQLAADGVILNHNYAQAMCTPSRHALLSGKYPYKSGMQHGVLGEETPYCSPTNNKFLGERFQELGYTTYAVGKWHLGFCQEACLPNNRGFDNFYGYYSGAEGYYDHRPGSKNGYDWRNNGDVDWTVDGDYNTFIINDYVVDKINSQSKDDPFFMYLAYANVHTPLEVPSKYTDMYPHITDDGRKAYLALATVMDESIGNIVNALKENGMYDNTIIVFTSDNGGEVGGNADNSPLRGGKASMWEGGSRVLGFVNSPLLKKANYVNDELFHIVDWTKTLMSIVGGTVENDVDGYDQSGMIMEGHRSQRREIVYNIDMESDPIFGQTAVRVDDLKLMWGHSGFVDGRGLNLLRFYSDPANLAQLGQKHSLNTSRSNNEQKHHDNKMLTRGAPSFTATDLANMVSLNKMWCWTLDNTDGGLVHLFNLRDDPNEEDDLADDPAYADDILVLKNYILDLLAEYKAPLDNMNQHWTTESNPANTGGVWTTGWCNNVDLNL